MKCISCQNEIQDGSINCPLCGAIQQVNNGVTLPKSEDSPSHHNARVFLL